MSGAVPREDLARVPEAARAAAAPPPAVVRERVAAGWRATPVWQNELGGLTYRLDPPAGPAGSGDGARSGAAPAYLKWVPSPVAAVLDLAGEAARLRWAAGRARVPEVLGTGHDEDGDWLLTTALPGRSAVQPPWRDDPARAAAGVGAGLRALHEALDVRTCPWTWSAQDRAGRARARLEVEGTAAWAPEHAAIGADRVLALLADPPPVEAVVCHGDACAPNTLLDDAGRPAGHVDLGHLGVADRWADLAVAAWSTEWNYGPGWGPTLLAAYGVRADPEREAFYRLLWDVT
ncbi:aminoglycoside 3'-phosphotransferase [Cellulomonas endophytica]|uniref:aminoglycoside 3'-phosphotransferase n=1 Tax=Cellulomonas endophytica TaxID=2494735 RepID=UPI0010117140|nr:aminoglycoside 3'-phosphotransferase [Cellulomonas endophytica]